MSPLRGSGRSVGPRGVRASLLGTVLAAGLFLLALPGWAGASETGVGDRPPPTTQPTRVPAGFPPTPEGYVISARQALIAADLEEDIRARKAELGHRARDLTASIEAENGAEWEVAYSLDGERVNLVVVDGTTGVVKESWTGAAVAWPMARGNEGQFGHVLNAPWVWLPLAAIFLLGLWDFRRWRRWAHLDLLVLLSFGISQAYFNAAEVGVSVPLAYPPLLYLLARMLWIAFRGRGGEEGRGTAAEGLRPSAPTALIAVGVAGLILLRILGNALDSGVIDVGYAGVVGADRITHAEPIYDDTFPKDNPHGDTYGPANYFAYVPFELAFPWSGSWDELKAGHAAAVFFDLATIAGLLALGLAARRSWRLGLLLAFAWAAYPYTALVTQSNSNDTLIAALLVWSLVAFASPVGRGVLLAAASLTKFAPLALVPLYAVGKRGLGIGRGFSPSGRWRELTLFAVAFLGFSGLLLAYPAVDPGLGQFYERTFASQLERESPFSVWGQIDLGPLHTIVKVAVVALGLTFAFFPRRRSLVQVAAASAALLIAVELTLEHWFYLYIPWFFGALAFALLCPSPANANRT